MIEVIFSDVGAVTNKSFYLFDFDFDRSSIAATFEPRPYGLELALCEPYLPAINSTSANYPIAVGQATIATASQIYIPFPVKARVPPTGVTTTAVGNFTLTNSSATNLTVTGINFAYGGLEGATLAVFNSGAGLTPGHATQLRAASAGQQILFTGCEL
jgi:hypothetical protein